MTTQLQRLLDVEDARVVVLMSKWYKAKVYHRLSPVDEFITKNFTTLEILDRTKESRILFMEAPYDLIVLSGLQCTNIVYDLERPTKQGEADFLLGRLRSATFKGVMSLEFLV